MANKSIDKHYLLETLKDFYNTILLTFLQKSLTVTTVPSDPENGDVIIYVGATSGSYTQGHTYKYDSSQTAWVDITPSANSTLAGLTDTTISSPSDGQILKYDNASSKWVNSNEQNVPTAYTSNPAMDGTASPGSSTNWAKGDHVHPSDTSKADNTTSFTEASARANIASGETIPTILGKIKKYFSDLKDLAYIAKDGTSSTKYLKGDGTWDTPTNTKNTAGSTDTSSKIYLIGATSQAANPQTYSDNEVFATDGVLSSRKVTTKAITAMTGTGTEGQDKGSGATNRYVPSLWTFNSSIAVANGEVYFIKIPVAGGTYGVWLSLNNGTNYYPVAVSNAKGRFTTQYAKDTVIAITYESAGICNCYAQGGADALAEVTGCFRVLNDYDANTTYTAMSSNELTTGTATTLRTVRADYLKTGVNSLIDTKINALDVTGASNIGAGKTISAWSETNGKVSLTTQDISITKSQVSDFPTLGSAASKDVPTSGNASSSQVVKGDDTRLTDARNAADVSAWAKAANKPSYTASEVGVAANPSSTTGTLTGLTVDGTSYAIPSTVQSDWDQSNTSAIDFIKNKPDVAAKLSYVDNSILGAKNFYNVYGNILSSSGAAQLGVTLSETKNGNSLSFALESSWGNSIVTQEINMPQNTLMRIKGTVNPGTSSSCKIQIQGSNDGENWVSILNYLPVSSSINITFNSGSYSYYSIEYRANYSGTTSTTVSFTNMMIFLGSDTDTVWKPYCMTNSDLMYYRDDWVKKSVAQSNGTVVFDNLDPDCCYRIEYVLPSNGTYSSIPKWTSVKQEAGTTTGTIKLTYTISGGVDGSSYYKLRRER